MIKDLYKKYILKYPLAVLLLVFFAVSSLGYFALELKIDASSDTLLLQHDKDLEFSRKIKKRYDTSDVLLVILTPKTSLFSKESISLIDNLSSDLEKLELVSSVTSIVNAPLFLSPTLELKDLVGKSVTIKSPKADLKLAKQEFLSSPLYKDTFVSSDFKTTALVVFLKTNHKYNALIQKRNELSLLPHNDNNNILLKNIRQEIKILRDEIRHSNHANIKAIRNILPKYENQATIFLGGVSMIVNDIVDFVKSDIVTYGSILIVLLVFMLLFIFRNLVWAVLPVIICVLSIVATTGAIGLFGWNITVISSNFIAIQLIITISIILHLVVRYRELSVKYTKSSQKKVVLNTILSKIKPSFFAVITTIAGFLSLMFADILPISDLGAMMSIGIILSFLISFLVFPASLMLTNVITTKYIKTKSSLFMTLCIKIISSKRQIILPVVFLLAILSLVGISQLFVENSFINYFKKDTQIYKSLKIVDTKLGGTTPLDIIITFDAYKPQDKDEEDGFLDDIFSGSGSNGLYWFTQSKMEEILKVHNYLESLDEIGSVRSFSSALQTAKAINKGRTLSGLELALLNKALPQKYKNIIISPYINIDKNQARFSTRIIDSSKDIRRNALLKKIKKDLTSIVSKEHSIRLSGLMVLYNNMLQSLFSSQIKTLGVVVALLFSMFLILFKSLRVSIIAMAVNIVPIGVVFAIMGLGAIPLDIMTITIAAISIGMGVDASIHYIDRFKYEFKKDRNYLASVKRTHKTIGLAMTYTSMAIIVGFSILIFSNLIPTIYFGLLIMLAMSAMLLSSLLFLPRLLMLFKPFSLKKH